MQGDPKPTGIPHWSERPDLWDSQDCQPVNEGAKFSFELPDYILEALAKRKAQISQA